MNDKKFDETAYKRDFNKKNYKNITVRLKFDDADEIINFCKDMNISINKLFVQSAKYVIDNDLLDEILHK